MSQRTFSPPFKRLNICDICIPSDKSIDLIMDEIGDDSIEKQFLESNNTIIALFEQLMCNPENNDDLNLRQLIIELIQNYQKISGVIGENEAKFIQSLAVVNWFAVMVSRMKDGNTQNLRKIFSSHHTYFKKHDYIELANTNKSYTPRYSDLKRFPEYATATQFLTEWYIRVINLSSDKPELRKLMTHERLLIKKILENREKSKNPYLNKCCFCQKLFLSDGGGGRAHCGSDECERRYSAGSTRKTRSQPHAIEEEKKRSSGKVTTQWIKVDNTYRWCRGVCSKRRRVDIQQICKQCHDEGFGF